MQNRGQIDNERKIGDIANLKAKYGRVITPATKLGQNLMPSAKYQIKSKMRAIYIVKFTVKNIAHLTVKYGTNLIPGAKQWILLTETK